MGMFYVFLQELYDTVCCLFSWHAGIFSLQPSSPPLRTSRWRSNILVRVLQLVVFAHEMLSPPLGRDVFHHQLTHVSLHEAANEPGIPEFRSNPQIFATAHQRVGLAALSRGGDAVRVKVLLFSAGE
jgi:hypothetical protein